MAQGALDQYVRSYDDELDFAEEEAVAQAAIVIARILERHGVSQRELAKRLGITEGRVSQILSAESNLTVKTLARIGQALGCRLQLDFVASSSVPEEETHEPARGEHAKKPWPGTAIQWEKWQPREEEPAAEEVDASHVAA